MNDVGTMQKKFFFQLFRSQHTFELFREEANAAVSLRVNWTLIRARFGTAFLTEAVLDFDTAQIGSDLKLSPRCENLLLTLLRVVSHIQLNALSKSSPNAVLLIFAIDDCPTVANFVVKSHGQCSLVPRSRRRKEKGLAESETAHAERSW